MFRHAASQGRDAWLTHGRLRRLAWIPHSTGKVERTRRALIEAEKSPEEEDEKEHESSGMSTVSINKLQILWDYFIHAEPQSYEVLA